MSWGLFPKSVKFNIIITNKNNIAIAPTYTIKKINAINSTSNKIKSIAALVKATISQKTECTGFKADITIIPDKITPNANR